MNPKIKNKIKKERTRTFLAKDFNSFRSELLSYARTYFPDKIQDFSEASFGGLLLDMASFVGDSMSFYLDHQFSELNPLTAVERKNIINHLRAVGVDTPGASPAAVSVRFYIRVPSEQVSDGTYRPKRSALPIVRAGTVCTSASGINFNLVNDINFAELNLEGDLDANITVSQTTSSGAPLDYVVSKEGICVSGDETTEQIVMSDELVPFREITLANPDVSDIMSVTDSEGNVYYQTETLSQDTVFRGILNTDSDGALVPMGLELIAAPHRFVANNDPNTRLTTLRFGSGDADTFDDDIIPDPSQLSLPLYGKRSFSRFSIDPNALLQTRTLGISPRGTTLNVRYRYGGGLSHNVSAGSIAIVTELNIDFLNSPTVNEATLVRSTIEVRNQEPARGGDSAPTLDELRSQIPSARQMQSRIVSKQDLLSRVYTMPNEFGRVYRAGIRQNPVNPLSTQLFIISRDQFGNLATSPDSLKKNLSTYLNEFRLISDAVDILDASISNFVIQFGIVTAPSANKQGVVQNVISRITTQYLGAKFQVGQPIMLDDITNIIINTQDVVSLVSLDILPKTGRDDDRTYSDFYFDYAASTKNRVISGPPGNIFELKYPEHDIIGNAV